MSLQFSIGSVQMHHGISVVRIITSKFEDAVLKWRVSASHLVGQSFIC